MNRYVHPRHDKHEVKFFHYQSNDGWGGITFAYAPASEHGNNVYEVSSAICNKADRYCRRVGREYSYSRFFEGKTILVRAPKDWMGRPNIANTLASFGRSMEA